MIGEEPDSFALLYVRRSELNFDLELAKRDEPVAAGVAKSAGLPENENEPEEGLRPCSRSLERNRRSPLNVGFA